jgi:uncharacterized membrane protein YesL
VEGLIAPFSVIARAVTDWWREWVNLAAVNLIWALCCLTVIFGPPATLGMYAVANALARGQAIGVGDLFQAGRRYFFKSWLWFLSNLLVAGLLWANLIFYAQVDTTFAAIVWGFAVTLGVAWLVVQFYALPYLVEQEEKRLWLAYRNGLFTALASPIYTLIILVFSLAVAALSVALVALLFLGGPCLIAVLGNHAVLERLKRFGVQ